MTISPMKLFDVIKLIPIKLIDVNDRAATIHPYIDETRYESQRYHIDTQAQYVSIFSRKLTRNYDGENKVFSPFKSLCKGLFFRPR